MTHTVSPYPIFLSVVFGVHDQASRIVSLVNDVSSVLAPLVEDYEVIIVDNGSTDSTINELQHLTREGGVANLQIYSLTRTVDSDTVAWVGLDNALGDFVVVIDPLFDDIEIVSTMLEHAVRGTDIVYALNIREQRQSAAYRASSALFRAIYNFMNGSPTRDGASQFRLLSKRVVNFILQHPLPAVTYRRLPITAGFPKVLIRYSSEPKIHQRKAILRSADSSLRLLVSATRGPMRIVTTFALGASLLNLVLSCAFAVQRLLQKRPILGWLAISLQQSAHLFVGSVVQLVFGEYILQNASAASEGPSYHIAAEYTSEIVTRRNRLNIETTV